MITTTRVCTDEWDVIKDGQRVGSMVREFELTYSAKRSMHVRKQPPVWEWVFLRFSEKRTFHVLQEGGKHREAFKALEKLLETHQ